MSNLNPRNQEDERMYYVRLGENEAARHEPGRLYPTSVPHDPEMIRNFYDPNKVLDHNIQNMNWSDRNINVRDDKSNDDEESLSSRGAIHEGFIYKVYSIICTQLVMTSLIVLLCLSSPIISETLVRSSWFFIFCIIGAVVTECMIICCTSFSKKVPNNYICLFAFTFFESMIVATLCASVNDIVTVFIAA